MRTKTNSGDFADFKRWVKFYIKELGLTEFEIVFKHEDCKGTELEDGVSGIITNTDNKLVTLYLNKDWGATEINNRSIKLTALHEVLHLLLSEYWHYAKRRFGVTEELLGAVEHAVVRRLENFILGD